MKIEYSKEGNRPLEDMVFVFTGALKSMSRDEAKRKVESLGGKTSNSVGKR